MKRYKYLMASLACVFASSNLFAQNEYDLLRFSRSQILGTARSQGMGGAFGAVGADFSATQINPAGIGLYRRNEAHFSMAVNANMNEATYLGSVTSDSRTNFHLPSMGVVLSKVYNDMGQDRSSGLVSINFGVGVNRIASYQQNTSFTGINHSSSVLDYLVERANGTDVNAYRNSNIYDPNNNYRNDIGAQAWETYLIDTAIGKTNEYTSRVDGMSFYNLKQQTQISSRGSAYEYNISSGANISNFLYLGASLVFTSIRHEQTIRLREDVADGDINYYKGADLKSEVGSFGTGVSGRFGVILKPVNFFRVGFSAQTPSRIGMVDEFKNITVGKFTTNTYTSDPQDKDRVEYEIITPARYTGSAAFVFSRFGLISADVEMVDYSAAKFKSDNIDYSSVNNRVQTNFQSTMNIRVGAEYKFDVANSNLADSYRLRAGWALLGSPYKTSLYNVSESNLQRQVYSGGFGMIFDKIFVDFAVAATTGKDYIQPYTLQSKVTPTAENSFMNYNFVLTGGIRF